MHHESCINETDHVRLDNVPCGRYSWCQREGHIPLQQQWSEHIIQIRVHKSFYLNVTFMHLYILQNRVIYTEKIHFRKVDCTYPFLSVLHSLDLSNITDSTPHSTFCGKRTIWTELLRSNAAFIRAIFVGGMKKTFTLMFVYEAISTRDYYTYYFLKVNKGIGIRIEGFQRASMAMRSRFDDDSPMYRFYVQGFAQRRLVINGITGEWFEIMVCDDGL